MLIHPNLYTSWQKPYNTKNFYSNFNLLKQQNTYKTIYS